MDTSDDRINTLLGRKDNEALNKILGKKPKVDEEIKTKKKTIKCPECGHEFMEE